MPLTGIESREVEVDGELTIELLADGVVVAELRWTELPPRVGEPLGWTLHRLPLSAAAVPTPWPWEPDAERELAQLVDALRDHARERTARNEMRVRFWERRARDASAVGAAAWGRERMRALSSCEPRGPWGRSGPAAWRRARGRRG